MAKKRIINKHHISYADDPRGEIIVKVYKGEHLILTRLSWTKNSPSKAFLMELKKYIEAHKKDAIDLDDPSGELQEEFSN